MTKSADPDQTAQNTKSYQGLHVLLTEICIRNEIKLEKKNKKKTPVENGLVHFVRKAYNNCSGYVQIVLNNNN